MQVCAIVDPSEDHFLSLFPPNLEAARVLFFLHTYRGTPRISLRSCMTRTFCGFTDELLAGYPELARGFFTP